ncbi:hypothetical protein [Nocardioides sp. YIM 152588]|uniref:hypothetical protein n=1 Tax=Nocardioides sp. YIM 152588 TaxID=3158259 RepID=UPI0032E38F9F
MQTPGRIAIALGTLALALAGCGDDEPAKVSASTAPASTAPASSAPASSAPAEETPGDAAASDGPTDATDGGPAGALQFQMATADGAIALTGTADACTNPDETTLAVTFTDGTTTVAVDASGGGGGIVVSGGTQFEGRVDTLVVGDVGNVEITGHGALADDTAEPTEFTILGGC